jgi:hypothetical protein
MTLTAIFRRTPAPPPLVLPAIDLRKLEAARCHARRHWQCLFCDPEVWDDPVKRLAMYRAREAYQEATLELAEALR